MTAYSFQGLLVDVKAYNWHMSAPVDTTLTSAGVDGTSTQISVGTIVADGGTGYIDVAQAASTTYLGVMNETRPISSATDNRSATYTWAGVVRVSTNGDSGAVLVGSRLMCGATGHVDVVTAAGVTAAETAVQFGRSLEATANTSATIIMAYICMA